MDKPSAEFQYIMHFPSKMQTPKVPIPPGYRHPGSYISGSQLSGQNLIF